MQLFVRTIFRKWQKKNSFVFFNLNIHNWNAKIVQSSTQKGKFQEGHRILDQIALSGL